MSASSPAVKQSSSPSIQQSVSPSNSQSSNQSLCESDYNLFSDAVQSFASKQHQLITQLHQSQAALDHCFTAHDANLNQSVNQWKEYERLTRMYHEIKERMEHSPNDQAENQSFLDRIETDLATLARAKNELDEWKLTRPSNKASMFTRLVLGSVSPFMHRKQDRLDFKNSYNEFKKQTTIIFVIFPLIQLTLVHKNKTLFQLHQLWLLYYYFTTSLRENILYSNGSSMKKWWIYHHYVSIAISLMLLLWPDEVIAGDRYQSLMYFGLVQGGVMLAQNMYQSKRAYVRKTLGKAHLLDVDATETLVEKPTDLKWLVPMLYGLYCYELKLGVQLVAEFCGKDVYKQYAHLLCIGLLCIALAVGNAVTTSQVLIGKSRGRKQSKTGVKNKQSNKQAIKQSVSDQPKSE